MFQHRLKMLVIEDNQIDQAILKNFFEKNNIAYDCMFVETVAVARKALENFHFDIVLADYFLADGKVSEVFDKLADTPLVLITAAADQEIAVAAMKAGAYDYLIKDQAANYLKILPLTVENAIFHKREGLRARLLSHVMTGISQAVCITDAAHNILFVNSRFSALYGFTEAELLGEQSDPIWEDLSDRTELIRRIIVESECAVINARQVRKDKTDFPAEISASIIDHVPGAEIRIVWISRDITVEKATEHQRELLQEQLRQSQKLEAIGRLAGGIAHDFNNILGSILGFTELAIEDSQPETLIYQNLKEVETAAHRAKALIEHMLAFGRRSERGSAAVDLAAICSEVVSLAKASLSAGSEVQEDPGIKIEFINRAASSCITGDISQIHRVLMNLCTNAVQAVGSNGRVLIELAERSILKGSSERLEPGPYLEIKVSDNGCGMDQEIIGRIFEPFFTTKAQGKGTGLGLSAAHGIIEDHLGKIEVESTAGIGSSFTVILPRSDNSETVRSPAIRPLSVSPGRGRIMFVDDEVGLVQFGKQVLERFGYQVVALSETKEAVRIFAEDPAGFDLLITDFTMPDMTGVQLGTKLREIKPGLPMILCTGFSETMTAERAIEIGFANYVAKPYSVQTLMDLVTEIIGGSAEIRI